MKYIVVDSVQQATYLESKDALVEHLEDICYDRLDAVDTYGTDFEVYEVGKAVKTSAEVDVKVKVLK